MMLMNRTALALTLISVFFIWSVIEIKFANAQFLGSVYINPDGSVTGTTKIQRNENIYTLTGNLSGSIEVQRSYIVIDGAGYAIEGNGEGFGIDLNNDHGVDPSRPQIKNVTIKNLKIANFSHAIEFLPSVNDTFIGNYVADCTMGFNIWRTANHTLMHNTIENCVTGITVSFGGRGNVITENNILNSSVYAMFSPDNTFDRNYWSDYLTKYPNAKEIGNTGIWDKPYEGRESFVDNHPLVEPVAINPELEKEEPFPTTLVLASIITVIVVGVGLLVYFKKRKH